ncbi:MAG: MOSC domain-containing protein [Beijerinckiaceae bacterium]|jgi:uncharacterized protein YcbX|nr:MOSC domain-containing protein [Beijerinckiaceae bacterium]
MSEGMRIVALHRYPLKGFSAERLPRVVLEAGGHFPADRMFAIENGPSGFDPARPEHQQKIRFLMLMKNDELARLSTLYDDAEGTLSIMHEGREVVRADLATAEGREAVERFLEGYVPAESRRGPFRVLTAPGGFRFTDSASGAVSLINLASVRDLEARIGAPVDPLRFRGNLLIEGLEPWQEFALVGQSFETSGGVRLAISKRIDRCAATAVDPQTGLRDLPVVRTLMTAYGHVDCGVYASIVRGGVLSEGQRLLPVGEDEPIRLGL